jgi:hypothetical protein
MIFLDMIPFFAFTRNELHNIISTHSLTSHFKHVLGDGGFCSRE